MDLQELSDINACDDRCEGRCAKCPNDTIREAVAEIERLQAAKRRTLAVADERSKENVALRAALKPFADYAAHIAEHHPGWDHDQFTFQGALATKLTMRYFRAARAAYGQEGGDGK